MIWTRSLLGAALASIYLLVAGFIAQEEIRHAGGGWITLRGMGAFILTSPSQLTLGSLLGWLGIPRVSYTDLGSLGYAQIVLHLLVTSGLVYLLGCGLEWAARRALGQG